MLRTTAAEGTKGDITAAARIYLAEGTDIAAAENPAEGKDIVAAGTERDISAAARIDPALVEA